MKKISFGRQSDNDIVLDNPAVSRIHGHLQIDDGRIYIVDDGSMNGIYVNGDRVQGKERLENGDQVMVSNRVRLNWERYAPAENTRTLRIDQEPSYRSREKAERVERYERPMSEQKKKSFWDGQVGKIVKYILTMIVSVTVMTLVTTFIRRLLA